MPPYLTRKCPDCGHPNNFDLALIKQEFMSAPLFRGEKNPMPTLEYPVNCKKCGAKFIIEVDDDNKRK